MNDDRPTIVVVPTELDRQDGFIDLAVLAGAALAVWWLVLQGVPLAWVAPWVVPLAVWVLTGEAAADVPFIGAIAAGLRNVFGLRRAHEWVFAAAHFWGLAIWPVWRRWLGATRTSSYRHGRAAVRTMACYLSCRFLAVQRRIRMAMRLRLWNNESGRRFPTTGWRVAKLWLLITRTGSREAPRADPTQSA